MDEEQRKTMIRPAAFANRVQITRQGNGTRLTFGEMVDGETFYSVAVMMSDEDVMAVRDLLIALFPPPEKQN